MGLDKSETGAKNLDEELRENAKPNPRDKTGQDHLQKGKDVWDDINRRRK